MLVQYKGLTIRAITGPGVSPLASDGPTVIVPTTLGVSVDGVPLRRWIPKVLKVRRTYLLECTDAAVALVVLHPPISSFEAGGVRFQT